jgi:hypothetical protein
MGRLSWRRTRKRLRDGQVLDPHKMPCVFMPRFRQPEIAEKLIEIALEFALVLTRKIRAEL